MKTISCKILSFLNSLSCLDIKFFITSIEQHIFSQKNELLIFTHFLMKVLFVYLLLLFFCQNLIG